MRGTSVWRSRPASPTNRPPGDRPPDNRPLSGARIPAPPPAAMPGGFRTSPTAGCGPTISCVGPCRHKPWARQTCWQMLPAAAARGTIRWLASLPLRKFNAAPGMGLRARFHRLLAECRGLAVGIGRLVPARARRDTPAGPAGLVSGAIRQWLMRAVPLRCPRVPATLAGPALFPPSGDASCIARATS